MEKISILRLLRIKYGITLNELAKAAGVSFQYVSDIELGKYSVSKSSKLLMQKAFSKVIAQRFVQLRRLSEAYENNRHCLLDFVPEEDGYEL